ncbi:MAG: hypothetical protein DRP06_02855 [Candidatus Aenigmatarchaeota archaeon]|nr:MAG: hypothetical protein DRP06_02855 [Candidatus Aenigmarchaeota archaeon]
MELKKPERAQTIKYYSDEKLQEIMCKFGVNREVVARNVDGMYFKRPTTIFYPNDIARLTERGAVSFHGSVERWRNPLLIDERNYDELRTGFDWVIDIDSGLGMEEANITACLIRNFIEKYNLKYILKFSGRRGFHFCVFWENFPAEEILDDKELRLLYPGLPKILSNYLREQIKEELWDKLVEHAGSIKELTKGEAIKDKNPFKYVEVEKDWSSRHLFRMPYSLHEKTGLASILIEPNKLEKFKVEDAKMENVVFKEIDTGGTDARKLIVDAYDWFERRKVKPKETQAPTLMESYKDRVEEGNFPPCIQKILEGIPDGRKRSVFTITTFLRSCNWPMLEVEKTVMDWGKKVGLKENYVRAQLIWHKKQNKRILPPNCSNGSFYRDIGICQQVPLCEKIKNPINFAIIKQSGGKKKRKRIKKRV